MSNIEKVDAELRALTAGVDRARGLTAAAGTQAQEVGVRAAGAGFAAVAAGMARVHSAIGEIQAGLGRLSASIGEAAQATATVPRQGTPQETISGLAPVQSAVDGARDAATAVISQAGAAQQLVTAVLLGGQPGPLLQALDGVKQVMVLIVQRTGAARQFVDAAAAEARQLGSAGN
ncbi:DUF6244 family protein [Micromonospora sp. NPDC049359]|uniref:DUF6244 family protein n=1 Tax=Micromonospora sp. NPDC049359 TaxID=3364270 RepID=UPI0037BCAAEC